MGIKQKRINKLKKYNLNNILGQGSFGMVFDASTNGIPSETDSNIALK